MRAFVLSILVSVMGCGANLDPGDVAAGSADFSQVNALNSALDVEVMGTRSDGAGYQTPNGWLDIEGGLNSVAIPRGYCPDQVPPQGYVVRWENRTTGKAGEVSVHVFCRQSSLFGVSSSGVDSHFELRVELMLGVNEIALETFQGRDRIGFDLLILRHVDEKAPQIVNTVPRADQLISRDGSVHVIFNEAMNEQTLQVESFSITDSEGNDISGALTFDPEHHVWSFSPMDLLGPMERYRVSIASDVEDVNGNALTESYEWFFLTGDDMASDLPFAIDAQWPGPECDCAGPNTRVLVQFNDMIHPGTMSDQAMVVRDAFNREVPGSVLFGGDYLEFEPEESLQSSTEYTVQTDVTLQGADRLGREGSTDWVFRTGEPGVGEWQDMLGTSTDQVSGMRAPTAATLNGQILFWGGQEGGIYDPETDTWSRVTGVNAPTIRGGYTLTAAGNVFILWGGTAGLTTLADGAIYDPVADQWTPLAAPHVEPGRTGHLAVWTGRELIVWGGYEINNGARVALGSGFRFDPSTSEWEVINGAPELSPRYQMVSAWTGSELLVWGGLEDVNAPLSDGAAYDPETDVWTRLPEQNAPSGSIGKTLGVWTGRDFIVWNGGRTDAFETQNQGMRIPTLRTYDPETMVWSKDVADWEPFVPTGHLFYQQSFDAHWADGQLLVVSNHPEVGTWLYDPLQRRWQKGNDHSSLALTEDAASVWLEGSLYRWGGHRGGFLALDEGQVFTP
ncbi:MAG: Ig-like domain-containing protein [Pseudomonadota bacterium]